MFFFLILVVFGAFILIGIRAVNYYGGFYMANTTDIEFGNIDCDKALAIEIKHDDKMKEDVPAYIQVSIVH